MFWEGVINAKEKTEFGEERSCKGHDRHNFKVRWGGSYWYDTLRFQSLPNHNSRKARSTSILSPFDTLSTMKATDIWHSNDVHPAHCFTWRPFCQKCPNNRGKDCEQQFWSCLAPSFSMKQLGRRLVWFVIIYMCKCINQQEAILCLLFLFLYCIQL